MDKNVLAAAHHECSHAIVAVTQGLPLQNNGIHIDTQGRGVICYLHREPGDRSNGPTDIVERKRTIIALKAGFLAHTRILPSCDRDAVAYDDRLTEEALLDEMYSADRKAWSVTDSRLTMESLGLVEKHWETIEGLAEVVLAKPVTLRRAEDTKFWKSPDTQERWMSGSEVAAFLKKFQLAAIVRDVSEGKYYSPDLHPENKQ